MEALCLDCKMRERPRVKKEGLAYFGGWGKKRNTNYKSSNQAATLALYPCNSSTWEAEIKGLLCALGQLGEVGEF